MEPQLRIAHLGGCELARVGLPGRGGGASAISANAGGKAFGSMSRSAGDGRVSGAGSRGIGESEGDGDGGRYRRAQPDGQAQCAHLADRRMGQRGCPVRGVQDWSREQGAQALGGHVRCAREPFAVRREVRRNGGQRTPPRGLVAQPRQAAAVMRADGGDGRSHVLGDRAVRKSLDQMQRHHRSLTLAQARHPAFEGSSSRSTSGARRDDAVRRRAIDIVAERARTASSRAQKVRAHAPRHRQQPGRQSLGARRLHGSPRQHQEHRLGRIIGIHGSDQAAAAAMHQRSVPPA